VFADNSGLVRHFILDLILDLTEFSIKPTPRLKGIHKKSDGLNDRRNASPQYTGTQNRHNQRRWQRAKPA